MSGSDYGSVDIAEILSAEVERLRSAIVQTLDANGHLADGEFCTLLALKVALRESGVPWAGERDPYPDLGKEYWERSKALGEFEFAIQAKIKEKNT
jgi:hypothetical protein